MTSQTPHQIAGIVGTNLKALRLARGLSQPEVAKELDIQAFQISRWEKGKHRPSDPALFALAAFFDVEYAYFFTTHDRDDVAA